MLRSTDLLLLSRCERATRLGNKMLRALKVPPKPTAGRSQPWVILTFLSSGACESGSIAAQFSAKDPRTVI